MRNAPYNILIICAYLLITCNDSPISHRAKIVAQPEAILSVRSPPVRFHCAVNSGVNSSTGYYIEKHLES